MSYPGLELALIALIGLSLASAAFGGLVARPWLGLVLLFGIVLLVERYPFQGSVTAFPGLYDNMNTSLGIPGMFLNPLEVLIGVISFGWGLRALVRRHEDLRIQTISLLGLLYGCWMIFSVVWGVVNGGNWKVALWILRPVIYFLITSFLTFQMVRTPRQVRLFFWVGLCMVVIKSFQIIIRKYTLGLELEAYGEHEDTSFALYYFWIGLSCFFLPFPRSFRWALMAALPVIMMGIISNDRRINIASGAIGAILILVLQGRQVLWKRRTLLVTAGAVGFLYLVVGWFGPTTPITAPVKGFKQGIRAELLGENTDNSSWYRKVERYNLRHTIRDNPILGTGLGVKYKQLIRLDTLTFEYFVYITHNQIVLVHSTTGSIGYFIFLTFFTALAAQLIIHYRWLGEGWQRALALAAALSVMNWLLVAYYDLQLFFYRNSVFMGIVVALPAVLFRHQLWIEEASSNVAPNPAGT